MTGSTGGSRTPGTTLLKIARLLFDERVFSAVVEPTIADLQREMAAAGSHRLGRLLARWRGTCAFWKVALVSVFVSTPAGAADTGAAFPDSMARVAVGSVVVALVAIAGPVLGAWAAVVVAFGALFALLLHAWYRRHPSVIPIPEPQRRSPQINFSSTEVDGNAGGLIFAVGAVFIVAIALPSLIVFLAGATVAGCTLAWILVAWRAKHPSAVPRNRIVFR